jgi:hypothetical protein
VGLPGGLASGGKVGTPKLVGGLRGRQLRQPTLGTRLRRPAQGQQRPK